MMIAICLLKDCSNKVFKPHDKCALHCTKSDYQRDKLDELLSEFYQLLNLHIFLDLTKDSGISNHESFELSTAIQLNGFDKESLARLSIVRKQSLGILFLRSIIFPYSDARDQYDYIRTLEMFHSMHFADCHFMPHSLRLDNKEVFFEFCQFNSRYTINNKHQILENERNCVYSACSFTKSVSIVGHEDEKQIIDFVAFDGCEFQEELKISNIEANTPLIQLKSKDEFDMRDEKNKNHVPILIIEDCILNKKMEFNYLVSEQIEIINTKFESKLEIKNTEVKEFKFLDSNVKGIFDAFGSTFIMALFKKSIFYNFAVFENIVFGTKNSSDKKHVAQFIHTTFKDFSSFRSTVFHSGLDFEKINLKEQPNFLKSIVVHDNTNRETFRIIKNSFDMVGNKIEANRFYVGEMDAYRKELKVTKGKHLDKFIFHINQYTSFFGQNYLLPVFWLLCLFGIYFTAEHAEINQYPVFIQLKNGIKESPWLFYPLNFFNEFALSIPVYGNLIEDGNKNYAFLKLLFNLTSGMLIWQSIVSVKRKIQR